MQICHAASHMLLDEGAPVVVLKRVVLADFHVEMVGQEAVLTDLPHMTMHPHGYQAMITDDDDWLQDFATAQLQAEDSPESAPSGSNTEQAGEATMAGDSNSQNTAGQDGDSEKNLDAAALHLGLQVNHSACYVMR